MRFFISPSENIYFNLAAEEFLLKHYNEEVCFLWKSSSAIVVGKHQNINAEINSKYAYKHNIALARRISGGGTVYHDEGNLNFTFIVNGEEGKLIDFKKHLNPIIGFLASIGLQAELGKTNELRINGLKISGNAEHVYRKRVLHHGTLLFNSEMEKLREAIKVVPGKYQDKAVQSNRTSVINIIEQLKNKLPINEFTQLLYRYLLEAKVGDEVELTETELEEINKLVNTKFNTSEWIYDYSPKYSFSNTIKHKEVEGRISFAVKAGRIEECAIFKNNTPILAELSTALVGQRHAYPDLLKKFEGSSYREILEQLV